jgi:hypothetical protein
MALNSNLIIAAGATALVYMWYKGRTVAPSPPDPHDIFALSKDSESDITHRQNQREKKAVGIAEKKAEQIILQANSASYAAHQTQFDGILTADDTGVYGGEHANVY